MKGIIIKDCLDCPFSIIENPEDNGGTLICELGKGIHFKNVQLCKMIEDNYAIPIWCRLDDLQETIDIAAIDYDVKYKEM